MLELIDFKDMIEGRLYLHTSIADTVFPLLDMGPAPRLFYNGADGQMISIDLISILKSLNIADIQRPDPVILEEWARTPGREPGNPSVMKAQEVEEVDAP